MGETAAKLVNASRDLIIKGGYNGFSYADLSAELGLRKPSIHHHFPSKVDLVVAVVEQSRAIINEQIEMLEDGTPVALDRLLMYTGYWERCIADQTSPFCLAGVLAAELPALPEQVGVAVRAHFRDLGEWLERVLTLGVEQKAFRLDNSPRIEAMSFMATVYGAMLAARAFDDPTRFAVIVESFLSRIQAKPAH